MVPCVAFALGSIVLALNGRALTPWVRDRWPALVKSRWGRFLPLATCVVAVAFELGLRLQWTLSVPEPTSTWRPSFVGEREWAVPGEPSIAPLVAEPTREKK